MYEVQRQYKHQLQKILRSKVSNKIKINMLQSFHQVLGQHCKIQSFIFNESFNEISLIKGGKKTIYQIQSTKFTQSISIDNTTQISQHDIQQLEQQILNKKILKISNYQQIQSFQQQLYQVEDIVEYKRKYNDHLRKQIDRKMIDIQQQKQKEKQNNSMNQVETRSRSVPNKQNHNKSFTQYFKSWWA